MGVITEANQLLELLKLGHEATSPVSRDEIEIALRHLYPCLIGGEEFDLAKPFPYASYMRCETHEPEQQLSLQALLIEFSAWVAAGKLHKNSSGLFSGGSAALIDVLVHILRLGHEWGKRDGKSPRLFRLIEGGHSVKFVIARADPEDGGYDSLNAAKSATEVDLITTLRSLTAASLQLR